tara:strand:- start:344 stop:1144 length:801 start_codon:yes stop_codon:yes gene_type:complete
MVQLESPEGDWETIIKEYDAKYLTVFKYMNDGNLRINPDVEKVVMDSARCYKDIDYTEVVSLNHCDSNITSTDKVYYSENNYKKHYDTVIGPLTDAKSIPDGSIVVNKKDVHLVSTFRTPKIIECYVCRKVQKLAQVALSEFNESTSLFYSDFPQEVLERLHLHFYIWVPRTINANKIKNVVKKIYRSISSDIPEFVNIHFNIFQTYGEADKLCWYTKCGICIYSEPNQCKSSKLRNIRDIRTVLRLFLDAEIIDVILCDTFFVDY